MPWKVSDVVSERMVFIARLKRGERMSALCREYGISRTTGYKFLRRYAEQGPIGFLDQSRRPRRSPWRTPDEVVKLLVEAREQYGWGARKLRKVLSGRHPGVTFPALSTISTILAREGLVEPRKRRRRIAPNPAPLSDADQPNAVWYADYKGEFRLGNRKYCYPLTISDAHSRFIISCQALEGTKTLPTADGFEVAFRRYGLPGVIRTDNGTPFASAQSVMGLSRLSIWWRRLGIGHERIDPGHPEQNGVHERMHRTLKQATIRPAAANSLQQQERFDRFVDEFNNVRPHEALSDETPAALYRPSTAPLPKELPEPTYPLHDLDCVVYPGGNIPIPGHPRTLRAVGNVLSGQRVGLRELDDGTWLVTFIDLDLGVLDPTKKGLQPIPE